MRKQLLLLLLFTATFGYAQELLVVDLTVENEITISSTTANSAASVSGSDTTGFYLENFFTSDQALVNVLVSGNLTSTPDLTDDSPSIFRATAGTDPGLNVWSYASGTTSTFTAGSQAFIGEGTWTLTALEYAAMLNAAGSGDIYFPADDVTDLATATLIGTYSVTFPNLGVSEVQSNNFTYYPNPVKDVLNISSQKVIAQVYIYNTLGQYVGVQKLNAINGAVNTASLTKGTYFVRATFEDGSNGSFTVVKN